MLDQEKTCGSDSTSQRQCVPLHCWGFYRVPLYVSAGPPERGLWGLAEQQFTCVTVTFLYVEASDWGMPTTVVKLVVWDHNTVLYTFRSGGYITLDYPQALPLFQTLSFPSHY